MVDEKNVESKTKCNQEHKENDRKFGNSLQNVNKHQNEDSKERKLAEVRKEVDP